MHVGHVSLPIIIRTKWVAAQEWGKQHGHNWRGDNPWLNGERRKTENGSGAHIVHFTFSKSAFRNIFQASGKICVEGEGRRNLCIFIKHIVFLSRKENGKRKSLLRGKPPKTEGKARCVFVFLSTLITSFCQRQEPLLLVSRQPKAATRKREEEKLNICTNTPISHSKKKPNTFVSTTKKLKNAQYFFTPTAILHTAAFFPKRIINTLPPFSPITAQNCSQGGPRQLHCTELPISSSLFGKPSRAFTGAENWVEVNKGGH